MIKKNQPYRNLREKFIGKVKQHIPKPCCGNELEEYEEEVSGRMTGGQPERVWRMVGMGDRETGPGLPESHRLWQTAEFLQVQWGCVHCPLP